MNPGDVKISIVTPIPMDIAQSLLHACSLLWPDGGIDPNGPHMTLVIPAASRAPKRVSKKAILAGKQTTEAGDDEPDLIGFDSDDEGHVSLAMSTPEELTLHLASIGQRLLDVHGAENYVESTVAERSRPDGERMVITVQRATGKTPHELRREAERELEALRKEGSAR